MIAQHMMQSSERYTPHEDIERVREVFGEIDLDPASSLFVNKNIVKASAFYDMERDGSKGPWIQNARTFINPPSQLNGTGRKGWGVKIFWKKLIQEAKERNVRAIWLGYSLEQLASLQDECDFSPLDFPICYVRTRINFLKYEDGEFVEMKHPTHANYFVIVNANLIELRRFEDIFSKIGKVVVPQGFTVGQCQRDMLGS